MVSVWTVDGPEAVRACRDMGVDGIITNDPARTRALAAPAGLAAPTGQAV